MSNIKFGCFGDDFTGASDAASFIKKAGLKTILVKDISAADFVLPEDTEAVVVALKIRTIPVEEAVAAALAAYDWLVKQGAEHIYYKYCSTFDSTDKGNIGPITDAILEKYNLPSTILCPALPVNGRTVKDGHLYVNGIPLNETHMRFHPLTPMLSSFIPTLMEKQGKYECVLLQDEELRQETFVKESETPVYLVPNYTNDADGENIARLFHKYNFLTGGSGILTPLCRYYKEQGSPAVKEIQTVKVSGRALLLAGSCSVATLGQIARFKEDGGASIKISPEMMFTEDEGISVLDKVWNNIQNLQTKEVLIYSSSSPEDVKAAQAKYGMEEVSARLEGLMAGLAQKAAAAGWEKIVVAGGETSGAVTEALAANAYEIGVEIAPGVPIMCPLNREKLKLALKSGNFGGENFFREALELMDN